MLKVKMLATTPGSPDGIRVISYREGEVYELPDNLAKAFVDAMHVAELATGKPINHAVNQTKMVAAAPENKMTGGTQDGKGQEQEKGKQEEARKEAVAKPQAGRRT